MKAYGLFAITIFTAMLFYSCSGELGQPESKPEESLQKVTITASLVDKPLTKTAVHYENGSYRLFWESGDKISLFSLAPDLTAAKNSPPSTKQRR